MIEHQHLDCVTVKNSLIDIDKIQPNIKNMCLTCINGVYGLASEGHSDSLVPLFKSAPSIIYEKVSICSLQR